MIRDLIDGPIPLLIWAFSTIGLAMLFYFTAKYGLRGFKFTDKDIKESGLNRRRRRFLKAKLKRKRSQKRIRF